VERKGAQQQDVAQQLQKTFFKSCEFEDECPLLPFPVRAVGTYSQHGIDEDKKKINQDSGCIVYPFGGNHGQALFAVLDGHGDGGDLISDFAMKVMHDTLEQHPGLTGDEQTALEAAFTTADRNLATEAGVVRYAKYGGATALAALMRGNKVWVANAGDSRCVLASRGSSGASSGGADTTAGLQTILARDLSTDQKPDTRAERKRIERSGGFVSDPEAPGFPARVWLSKKAGGTGGGLAVARSIGDHGLKRVGVTASPEVKAYDLTKDDLFMILATDGLWEFISSQEAAEIVWGALKGGSATAAEDATALLVGNASHRWREEEGDYRDDITVIVVKLPLFDPSA
jgi:serine/threonine protein phosphatase PrpC